MMSSLSFRPPKSNRRRRLPLLRILTARRGNGSLMHGEEGDGKSKGGPVFFISAENGRRAGALVTEKGKGFLDGEGEGSKSDLGSQTA